MNISIRQEKPSDYLKISEAIIATYKDVAYSNHREQLMVDRLKASACFIPELSLVAEDEDGTIVGHVLLTRIEILKDDEIYPALALAPLSVRPAYQHKGIGKALVAKGHRIAKNMGYDWVVILGIPDYYLQFGYDFTVRHNLQLPIKINERNSFITSLKGTDFTTIKGGAIKYPDEFFG